MAKTKGSRSWRQEYQRLKVDFKEIINPVLIFLGANGVVFTGITAWRKQTQAPRIEAVEKVAKTNSDQIRRLSDDQKDVSASLGCRLNAIEKYIAVHDRDHKYQKKQLEGIQSGIDTLGGQVETVKRKIDAGEGAKETLIGIMDEFTSQTAHLLEGKEVWSKGELEATILRHIQSMSKGGASGK